MSARSSFYAFALSALLLGTIGCDKSKVSDRSASSPGAETTGTVVSEEELRENKRKLLIEFIRATHGTWTTQCTTVPPLKMTSHQARLELTRFGTGTEVHRQFAGKTCSPSLSLVPFSGIDRSFKYSVLERFSTTSETGVSAGYIIEITYNRTSNNEVSKMRAKIELSEGQLRVIPETEVYRMNDREFVSRSAQTDNSTLYVKRYPGSWVYSDEVTGAGK